MKLLFKQRFFSWFDSYDIYDENGKIVFTVKGELAWGHLLRIYNENNQEIGMIKEQVFTFLPRFKLFINNNYIGQIKREFTFFKPRFVIDYNGWKVNGNFIQWDYEIVDKNGKNVATISRQLWNFTDTYAIDIIDPKDTLAVLMVVLAIDAEKCSRD